MNDTSNNIWQKNKIFFKGILITFLILILLIPTLFIQGLIHERSRRSESVKQEIANQWGNRQEIRGPVLCIPYWSFYKEGKQQAKTKKYAFFLPEELNITGDLSPHVKHRSIFDVVVYTTQLQVEGNFKQPDFAKLRIEPENVIYNEAQILFGISDFKGIYEEFKMELDTHNLTFSAGMPSNKILSKGLNAPLHFLSDDIQKGHHFKMSIHLRGTEGLFFIPLGNKTKVKLSGNWPDPAFEGMSPESKITDSNFTANWSLLGMNRDYPQEMTESNHFSFSESAFGVNLIQPVNHYGKNIRSVKYAILVLMLTFLVYFFMEILQKKPAHVIHYVLIGTALCIFYTLLLSFSEVVGFNMAYLIASASTVILLMIYTASIFQSKKSGIVLGIFLAFLYGFIYSLIQLQDTALLAGSIGLFIILSLVMYISRKINWSNK